MNQIKYITKVKGTVVYKATGDYCVKKRKLNYTEQPYDEQLDVNAVVFVHEDLLIIHKQEDDEQPITDLIILKDWETRLVEEEISDVPCPEYDDKEYNDHKNYISKYVFYDVIPSKLKKILNFK